MLTEFENRASDGSMFTSEDALGIYIENVHNSVHGWIADLYGEPEFGGFDSCKFFMFYQWHGMIDTWRGHWLSTHKRALKDFVDASGQALKIREVPKAIQDVLKHVVKEVVDAQQPKAIEVPKNPKELVEVPGNGPIPDPALSNLAQRLAQLETVVHRQAFIRGEERPKVG
jgi:hypothetical protein